MADKKMDTKGIEKKIIDLKIELLKNPTKRGSIKKEIARLLTMRNITKDEKLIVNDKKEKVKAKAKLMEGQK